MSRPGDLDLSAPSLSKKVIAMEDRRRSSSCVGVKSGPVWKEHWLASSLQALDLRNIARAIKRAEVEATPVTRKSPEKLLKFRLLELMMVPSF
ncbi:hypothetical protein GUJ93_ZPchr0009g223 [Zizania palustris]|uniref:Uncharacterized protein n=1 Tax=Zizania palustris TaxID=103762 RepID=A0A8J5RPF3_ZIZPA|nr:hypothetical protein GUJ93_ZPchr0009g223 [Zizania palustris]